MEVLEDLGGLEALAVVVKEAIMEALAVVVKEAIMEALVVAV